MRAPSHGVGSAMRPFWPSTPTTDKAHLPGEHLCVRAAVLSLVAHCLLQRGDKRPLVVGLGLRGVTLHFGLGDDAVPKLPWRPIQWVCVSIQSSALYAEVQWACPPIPPVLCKLYCCCRAGVTSACWSCKGTSAMSDAAGRQKPMLRAVVALWIGCQPCHAAWHVGPESMPQRRPAVNSPNQWHHQHHQHHHDAH